MNDPVSDTVKAAVLPEGMTTSEFVHYTLLIHRDRERLLLEAEMEMRFCEVSSFDDRPQVLAAKTYAAMTALAEQMDLALTEPYVKFTADTGGHLTVTAGVFDPLAVR